MPTSTKADVPPQLWALIHDLLNTAGLSKVAKSLNKRVDVEVQFCFIVCSSTTFHAICCIASLIRFVQLPSTDGMETLVSIFKKYQAENR
jgi:hypothetical protein